MTIISRTIHVTVTLSVTVDVQDGKTVAQAIDFAKQNLSLTGNEFGCEARVFEVNTTEEDEKLKTAQWRSKYVK